ncbi:hypothetical protein SAMN02745781_04139 [Vibrio gazogenes DSM 21264]|uniref:Uncharacterized protein n=1 Tax=Vibrio gazogenes DSM 21264 = NBRC 103151 TaxID=1123492 RepID=A0A1M5HLV7_VIBGA|nr:hypothetical protein SAMN02745781_04139 [Vibrio gazogenes DSM 21264] [Vibrio gazogenes DSM 21264 = NBRC 103151]SJN58408.1 hypothetical protein BQ6471_03008 [Vibrio gazogenes]
MLFEKCKPVYVGETGSIATFEMSAIGRPKYSTLWHNGLKIGV